MYVYRMMRSERVTRGISFPLVESSSRLLTEPRVLSGSCAPNRTRKRYKTEASASICRILFDD